MAQLLSQIQDHVRFLSRKSDETITSGDGLAVADRAYRELATLLPWSEFRRADLTITTTAETGIYDWPTDPVMFDIKAVEVQDGDDADRYKPIFTPKDELEWGLMGTRSSISVPEGYLRFMDPQKGIQFEVRPVFKFGSKTVRITGIVEPKEFVDGDSGTAFRNRIADDALARLIAAELLSNDGFEPFANIQKQAAARGLRRLFGRDLVPDELLGQITGVS